MARRELSRVQGFVHNILTVASLSDVPNNMRLLSDRSLYILQNLSGYDVTFLSRYGEIEDGGYYLPVLAGSVEAGEVETAVNLIRRDLNDMTVEATLECICSALNDIAGSISAAQGTSCGCEIGTDVETTDGQEGGPLPDPVNGIPYESPSPIVDRKCKASNYIHNSIRDIVTELKLKRADAYAYAGLAAVLSLLTAIIGGVVAGPFGAVVGGVAGAYLAGALQLYKASFNLSLLESAILSDEQGAICALYLSSSASAARSSYVAHLALHGATSLELEFIELFLSNNVLNLLFFEWGDSASAIENVAITHSCETCGIVYADWIIAPSGIFGINVTGGGPMGSGVVQQDGSPFVITAVPIDNNPGWHAIGLEVQGYADNSPLTSTEFGQLYRNDGPLGGWVGGNTNSARSPGCGLNIVWSEAWNVGYGAVLPIDGVLTAVWMQANPFWAEFAIGPRPQEC